MQPLPDRGLAMIRDLVPCDVVALFDGRPSDRTGRRVWTSGLYLPWSTAEKRLHDELRSQGPLGPSAATISRAVRTSDIMSQASYRRTDLYQLLLRPHGIEHSMDHWLPGRLGRIRGLGFDSGGRDFSDRDREVVEVLGRHLSAVFGRLDPTLPASPTDGGLTRRQAEILALVAEGRTNGQIAEALSISPRTVQKHLENVFGLLGVRSRAAAVGRLFGPGRARPHAATSILEGSRDP